MTNDILILSGKDKSDQLIQEIIQTMKFHERETKVSILAEEEKGFKVILVDQFIKGQETTRFLSTLREKNEDASIFLLSSRDFTRKEEELINSNKVSVMALPLIEADLYNRIIA